MENTGRTNEEGGDALSVYVSGFKSILTSFTRELTVRSVDQGTIKEALTAIYPETMSQVKNMHKEVIDEVEKFLRQRDLEERRSNYLGRAILHNMEEFFPKTRETSEKIIYGGVDGMLPREIAQGVINAVENAQGYDMIEEYERKSRQIAQKYRVGKGGLIDLDAFVNDSEIKMMVREMLGNLKKMLEKRDKRSKMEWLTAVIESSPGFQKMERNLSNTEYSRIVESLFADMMHG